jgi:hypothetical protein
MRKTIVMAGLMAALLGSAAFAQNAAAPAAPADAGQEMGMGHEGMMGMDGMDPAIGGRMGSGMGMSFTLLDTNGDGQVTVVEIEARQAAWFATADADGSSGLSAEEMVAMAETARHEMLAAAMTERVARIDDNSDGQVQAEEMTARMPNPMMTIGVLDADNDGAITQAEFDTARERFDNRGPCGEHLGEQRGERGSRGWGFWNHSHSMHGG